MTNSRPLNLNNDDAIIPIPRKKRNKRNKHALQPVLQSAKSAAELQASIDAYITKFRLVLGQSITTPIPLQARQTGHRIFSMLNSSDLNNYALTSRQAYIDVREWQRQNQLTLFAAPVERSIKDAQIKMIKKSEKADTLTHFTSQAYLRANEITLTGIYMFLVLIGAAATFLILAMNTHAPYWVTLGIPFTLLTSGLIVPGLFQQTCAPALSKHFTEVKSDYDTTAEVLNALAATLNDTPISEVLQQINQHFGEHDAPEEEDDLMKMEAGLHLSDESSHHEADVADEETPLLLKRK